MARLALGVEVAASEGAEGEVTTGLSAMGAEATYERWEVIAGLASAVEGEAPAAERLGPAGWWVLEQVRKKQHLQCCRSTQHAE